MNNEHQLHIEEQILGFILCSQGNREKVSPFVLPEFFSGMRNIIVYKAILKADDPNIIEVGDVIEKGELSNRADRTYLSELIGSYDFTTPIRPLIKSIRTNAEQRMLTKIMQECKTVEDLQKAIHEMNEKFDDSFENEDQTIMQVLREIYNKREEGNVLDGCTTGFNELDSYIYGLIKGKFLVVGGYNNHGKSTLAINFLNSALKAGSRCLFFSLEMEQSEILIKVMACRNEIEINKQPV